ncbi:3-oxoacid CoA-transferase subunit B [Natranaerobius thermophilus]|uniref:Butyryl-CoA:acetate CoA transferase n=1 Tax=Natranaerobius thermophilus (strain ATCC BAA-1301 / DSM 18059 / JW/NM-WN-LF) TaxID=457570 RepID=B2A845_NATTJ|nr:3-oxoacid CoA-transferase subunit B [Natranaerobius thermophilus]ACB85813.1 butyryl-CoA:acetate CoA transferase [Natranaerobius thermophilus JW/NM-WN-LF]
MDKNERRNLIARRIAREFQTGEVVNLGIGMPTLVANFIDEEQNITIQSENGIAGVGPTPEEGQEDPDLTNAGGQPVSILPGGTSFDSAESFSIIRGGHLDSTVLGALEVDEKGNLANWMVPGKIVPGMGGAMDLVVGAKKVIIATDHVNKNGEPKILKQCNLPLTAEKEVDLIVTDLAVIEITSEGAVLLEVAEHSTVDEVVENTEANLIIPDNIGVLK